MNTYAAFYKSKRISVEASTTYEAQQKAAAALKVPSNKQHQVHVFLTQKEGETVEHSPAEA